METRKRFVGRSARQQHIAEILPVAGRSVGEDRRFHPDLGIRVSDIDGDRAAVTRARRAFGDTDDQIHAAAFICDLVLVDVGEQQAIANPAIRVLDEDIVAAAPGIAEVVALVETLKRFVGCGAGQQHIAEILAAVGRAIGEDHRFHPDLRIRVSDIDGDRTAVARAQRTFGDTDDQIHAAALVRHFAFIDVGKQQAVARPGMGVFDDDIAAATASIAEVVTLVVALQRFVGRSAGQQHIAEILPVVRCPVGEDHRFDAYFGIGRADIEGDRTAIASARRALGDTDDQVDAVAFIRDLIFVDVSEKQTVV